jgi:hypothetical protein
MEFRWRHKRVALYLCLDCRLKELSINEEPSPPQVIAYSDTVYGGDVVPRITAIEAKQQYCVDVRMLESLPCKIAYPVKTAVEPGATKLYEERDIVREGRRMYGGSVGISNARKVLAEQGEQIEMPPVGQVRERRNRIRQAFLAKGKGYFATPELTLVHDYVQFGRGALLQIVDSLTD